MRRRMVRVVVVGVVAALATTGTATAVVPANGGDVGGTMVTINDDPGDQTWPRVSGDLASYTYNDGSSRTIRYFDLSTGIDHAIPVGLLGDSDYISDVDGRRIVFSRTRVADGQTAVMVFDIASGVVAELDPQPVMQRLIPVIGGDTVAYHDELVGNRGDVFAYDLVAGTVTNLSHLPFDVNWNPAVAPSGDVVVWERCLDNVLGNCDILQSVRGAGTWGAPTPVAATQSIETNPDTDGTTVVYGVSDVTFASTHIAMRPVAGGPELTLELPGEQRNPSISDGVVAFESRAPSSVTWDLYAYVVATNTLLRVTDTPTLEVTFNDVTVLPNGDVRVVWAARPRTGSEHDVFARTFILPAVADTTPPVVTITTPPQGATYTKDQAVVAAYACVDEAGGSGLASCDGPVEPGDPVDTATVGSHAFTVVGADNAGNSTTVTHAYSVVYAFDGFFSPVDDLPVLNVVKGGQAIPVRFGLGGDQGLSIFEAGYPKSQQVPCDSAAPVDGIEETVTAGASNLSYDATSDEYSYVWKTEKGWANTCRQLVLKLVDGSFHRATFKFR